MHHSNEIITRLQNDSGIPQSVTQRDISQHVEQTSDTNWNINYHGAVCKFEQQSHDTGIIYHLHVPQHVEHRGIGTALITTAEQIFRTETTVTTVQASIGASDGATEYVLCEKCGFSFGERTTKEGLGVVVNTGKQLLK